MHVTTRSLFLALAIALLPATSAFAAGSVTVTGGGNVPEGGTTSFQVSKVWASSCAPAPCHEAEAEPTFTMTLSDGSAVAPGDYGSDAVDAGAVACGPGACTRTEFHRVSTVDDNIDEPDETFTVSYSWSAVMATGGGTQPVRI